LDVVGAEALNVDTAGMERLIFVIEAVVVEAVVIEVEVDVCEAVR
jgi:hypothetical protein